MVHRVGGSACALHDELVKQARAGDLAALEMLVRALPRELPAAVRLAVRNDRIRRLGYWLCSELPGSAPHLVAALLGAAGRRIEAGRGLGDAPPFDVLAGDERARLAAEIRDTLRWSPAWPAWRQMLRILSFDRVAMTEPSDGPSAHGHLAEEPTDHRHRSTQIL